MPICEQCHEKWSWWETIRTTTTLNPTLICPYCDNTQYVTQRSRMQMTVLPLISLLPLLLSGFTNLPKAIVLGPIPLLAIFALSLYPFLVHVGNEDETRPPLH